jgi:hypothetical protein
MLGATNAGKSSLFNRLLDSDFCQPLASEAIRKTTTSIMPHTTQNFVRFPINFLDDKKLNKRNKRLFDEQQETLKRNKETYQYLKKNRKNMKIFEILEALNAYEPVGNTFKKSINLYNQLAEMDSETTGTYSFDAKEGAFNETVSYPSMSEMRQQLKLDAREKFKTKYMDNSFCFYDTPGIITTPDSPIV